GGYLASLYLLIVSVVALANLERTLRSAEERVRWEIKFLVLGLAASFATFICLASNVLLSSPRYSLLPRDALQAFPVVLLLSSLLIFISLCRSSGRSSVAVSQSLIFSSITFLSVGTYLISSTLAAKWADSLSDAEIELQMVVFLLSLIALGVILLSTSFRHRVRRWIRRNIFAGKYDYRFFW